MHLARLIIVLFLTLAIVLTYSPLVRGEVSQAWTHARPDVILLMDGVYATFRNFIAGTDAHDGVNDDAPGVDYDIIITEERGVLF